MYLVVLVACIHPGETFVDYVLVACFLLEKTFVGHALVVMACIHIEKTVVDHVVMVTCIQIKADILLDWLPLFQDFPFHSLFIQEFQYMAGLVSFEIPEIH